MYLDKLEGWSSEIPGRQRSGGWTIVDIAPCSEMSAGASWSPKWARQAFRTHTDWKNQIIYPCMPLELGTGTDSLTSIATHRGLQTRLQDPPEGPFPSPLASGKLRSGQRTGCLHGSPAFSHVPPLFLK